MRALVLALALAACAAHTPPAPEDAMPAELELNGSAWRQVGDGEESMRPTLSFSSETRAAGFAGCNRWFADVNRTNGGVTFGAVGTTRMMCPPAQMDIERQFLERLSQTMSAHLDGRQLVLLGDEAAELARFDPAPEALR